MSLIFSILTSVFSTAAGIIILVIVIVTVTVTATIIIIIIIIIIYLQVAMHGCAVYHSPLNHIFRLANSLEGIGFSSTQIKKSGSSIKNKVA